MGEATREMRDRAVAVARDVLKQIRLERGPLSVSDNNGYCMPVDDIDRPAVEGLQACADYLQQTCEVCMLGALLLSKARLFDAVPMPDWNFYGPEITQNWCHVHLSDAFTESALGQVESAFEARVACNIKHRSENYGAAVFGARFKTSTKRAEAIARNIIEHDGLFVVPDATREEYDRRSEGGGG